MTKKFFHQVKVNAVTYSSELLNSVLVDGYFPPETKFSKWAAVNPSFFKNYMNLISKIIDENFRPVSELGDVFSVFFNTANSDRRQTMLIHVPKSDNFINCVAAFLQEKYPQKKIHIFKDGDKEHPNDNNVDILIIDSYFMHLGLQMPKVKTIVNLDPYLNSIWLMQLLGRFDFQSGEELNFFKIHTGDDVSQAFYQNDAAHTLKENVDEYKDITMVI